MRLNSYSLMLGSMLNDEIYKTFFFKKNELCQHELTH